MAEEKHRCKRAVVTPLTRKLTAEEVGKMRAAWDAAPPVTGCKGLCWDSCTNVPLHPVEAYYLIEKYGAQIYVAGHPADRPADDPTVVALPTLGPNFERCGFLTAENRCSIYEDRPLVCRLFGHRVLTLSCVHGCDSTNCVTDLDAMVLMLTVAQAFDGFQIQPGEDLFAAMLRTIGEMDADPEEVAE